MNIVVVVLTLAALILAVLATVVETPHSLKLLGTSVILIGIVLLIGELKL